MAAQIPIKDDAEANKKAMEGVYADKLREVRAGHEYVTRFIPCCYNDLVWMVANLFTVELGNYTSVILVYMRREDWHLLFRVAHPALAKIATDVFNKHMPTPNQIFKRREDVSVTSNDLLNMNMPGTITEEGIRKNIDIGLGYMEGWLRAVGCVPLNYLMEDAATAEVSRSQVSSFNFLDDLTKFW